jgi:hypothetical protein
MDGVRETRGAEALSSFFAGLQAGLQGVVAMLVWLGVSATWQRRTFWTTENLMASLFYGNRAIRSGFVPHTLSGLAVYLLLYSLLGGLLAFLVRDRVARLRVLMLSLLFALVWYYLSYRLLWRAVAPLVALLHVERATVLGHLVYGTLLARYPLYLPQRNPSSPVPPAEPPAETAAPPAEAPSAPAVDGGVSAGGANG